MLQTYKPKVLLTQEEVNEVAFETGNRNLRIGSVIQVRQPARFIPYDQEVTERCMDLVAWAIGIGRPERDRVEGAYEEER